MRKNSEFRDLQFFLFGSFVNGLAKTHSDIDFAEIGRDPYRTRDYSTLRQKLDELGLSSIEISGKPTHDRDFVEMIGTGLLDQNRVGVLIQSGQVTLILVAPNYDVQYLKLNPSDIANHIQLVGEQ